MVIHSCGDVSLGPCDRYPLAILARSLRICSRVLRSLCCVGGADFAGLCQNLQREVLYFLCSQSPRRVS
jgi:hypothetical protein